MRMSGFKMEAVERSLDGFAMRQAAIANNIANLNTPHYVNQAVDFEDSLREALSTAERPSSPAEFGTQITASSESVLLTWQPETQHAADGAQRLDGNTTPLASQMSAMAQNAIQYDAVAMAIAREMQLLKAISQAK